MHQQNFALQQDNLAYQKEMQQQAWAREDNAVQRRADDMRAAGINPILAAGSPAQASPAQQTQAPQQESTRLEEQAMKMNLIRQQTEIARSFIEMEHISNQDRFLKAQTSHQQSMIQREQLDMDIRNYDWRLAKEMGLRTTDTGIANTIASMARLIQAIRGGQAGILGSTFNKAAEAIRGIGTGSDMPGVTGPNNPITNRYNYQQQMNQARNTHRGPML